MRDGLGGERFELKVLVVEDQPLLRQSVVTALERGGFAVETAADAVSAKHAFDRVDPDGLVVDVDLGEGPSGLDLIHALRTRDQVVPAVVLTRFSDPRLAGRELGADGVTAFLTKQQLGDSSRLLDAVSAVIAGEAGESLRDDRSNATPASRLTGTQLEVLELVAEGLTNAEIADRRGTSQRSVEITLARAIETLGIAADPARNPRVLATKAYLQAVGLLDGGRPSATSAQDLPAG